MTATILRGNALDLPLADASVDLVVTSPPYFALRSYTGTGTTALVAHALGRHGISVDMSADYCRLAEWRTTDPGELARALQVDRPDPVDPAQPDLLALLAED